MSAQDSKVMTPPHIKYIRVDVAGDDSEEIEYYNIPWTGIYRLNVTAEKEFGAEMRALRDSWTWKDDDIIIHGFPRSGNHLAWNMTRYIFQGSTDWFPDPMEDSHYCGIGLKDIQKGRRVLTTHFKPVDFRENFWPTNGKRKHIIIMRNWKDTAVSYWILFHQHLSKIFVDQGPFGDDYLKDFCYGQVAIGNWFALVRGWEEYMYKNPELPIMIIFYEDIVADSVSAVRKIAHFLDCPINEQLVQEIARKCEFKEMQKQPLSEPFVKEFKESASSNKNLFFRKGKVGDWKNHFTVQQNEWGDAAYEDRMKGSKLRFRYE